MPLIGFFLTERTLQSQLASNGIGESWQLYDGNGQLLDANLNLPFDLRFHEKGRTTKEWILKRDIQASAVMHFSRPTIVLGRIGDSDQVRIGKCLIGSTGFSALGDQEGWWWGAIRAYEIPKKCAEEYSSSPLPIEVRIRQWGFANSGIYAGVLGLGEYESLSRSIAWIEFFRFKAFALFGLLGIAIGIYYLFVFLLARARSYNGAFSGYAISMGIYEVVVSAIPYRLAQTGLWPVRINFLAGASGVFFFLWFLRLRLRSVSSWVVVTYAVGTALLLFIGLPQSTSDGVFKFYSVWFGFFLIMLCIGFGQLILRRRVYRMGESWRYIMGAGIFLGCCVYDVIVASALLDLPYLGPYGFMMVTVTAALALAKEYADAFQHVEEQVADRTKDLGTALDQLRAMERMKERFFANVSHDFKTPITIALGVIEDTTNRFKNSVAEALRPADRSLRRLLDLVGTMLDTVKAESGTMKMEWLSTKPAEFVRRCSEPYRVLCDRKGIELNLQLSGFEGLTVPMDPKKMERVIENLLSNAVKFTDRREMPERRNRETPIVRVSLRTDSARLFIDVEDSGIGIPVEEREKIFDRYYQSTRTSLKQHGGSGIGLAFAKEMVELHNGQISVEESEFGGSKFVVALPLSQDVEITGEFRVDEESGKEIVHGSLDVAYPPERPSVIDKSRPKILVAEDNPEVAQIVRNAIAEHYNVFFAPNGRRALEVVRSEAFDCVLSDIMMPEMRGDDLLREIRKDPKVGSIPVVMLSSHGDEETVVALLQAGANDYVTKPFRREVLVARLRTQIQAFRSAQWRSHMVKLQELGQLAAGIGHQAKNRMGRIKSNYPALIRFAMEAAELAKQVDPDSAAKLEKKIKSVGELVEAGYLQTERLMGALDRYASGATDRTKYEIEEVIEDTLSLLADEIKRKGITVEKGSLKGLGFLGYNEYREAVLNIVSNAIDALPEDGSGKIEILGSGDDANVSLMVRDNGAGIDLADIGRIFEPFFTSKPVGKGTGLGLFLARDFIELQHGGSIQVSSKGRGFGATFTITVPREAPEIRMERPRMHGVEV